MLPGSQKPALAAAAALLFACEAGPTSPSSSITTEDHTANEPALGAAGHRGGAPIDATSPPAEPVALGVTDRGVFSDLDADVQLELPDELGDPLVGRIDDERRVLILYAQGWPVKAYPLPGDGEAPVADRLRPADHRELRSLWARIELRPSNGTAPPPGDADGDGIPDPLDILVGAHKTVLNGAAYGGQYTVIDYPGGDIPRDRGVCTDVVIRAVRNAGVDLQLELQRDIRRAPRAYPMAKKNPNIDHRRVKTLLPYFERRWDAHTTDLDDPADPLRPGDVLFMDTFPRRRGPDHIGIVSDRRGDSGLPLVINNWTDGTRTSQMDLLESVPVTHRFRVRSR